MGKVTFFLSMAEGKHIFARVCKKIQFLELYFCFGFPINHTRQCRKYSIMLKLRIFAKLFFTMFYFKLI